MARVDIGKLDQRIVIESLVITRASDGEELPGWALVAEVWGNIRPMRGQEKLQANMVQESADTVITVRWAPALDTLTRECRLRHRTTIFDVKDLVPVDFAKRWIEFYATTGLNAG